jgi:type I restriction enzyme S subunit
MREDWKKVKFSELFNNPKKAIISGPFGSNLKSAEYQSEGVPLVRLQNVDRWKFINKNIIYITSEKAKELSSHSYKSGDILISKLGAPLGKACIAPKSSGEGIVLADIVRVRVDENSHNKDFIVYQLNSEDISAQLRSLTTGATRPRVTLKNVRELSFVRPPLPQQKQIVAILDKAFAAIDAAKANAEQNLQNAKELFESYLQNVFENKGDDWQLEKLGVLGKLTSSKRIYKKEYVSSGVPFYRSKEIKELSHKRKLSIELYISEQRYTEIKNKFGIPKQGDLLLTAVGTIGEMYIVKKDEKFYFKDGNIMWLKDFSSLNSYYLKYALTNFVERLKALSQGAAYSALTIEKLKEYSIPIPPIEEQEKIVKKLDALSVETKKLEAIYTQKIADLEEMKKSVLQKAFSGQLNTLN